MYAVYTGFYVEIIYFATRSISNLINLPLHTLAMRLIRRLPRLRRRLIIARRCRSKVYWYFRNFKEEFIAELKAGREEEEEELIPGPLYYKVYRCFKAIPPGLRDYIQSWRDDYAKWVRLRDNTKLEFRNLRQEVLDLHSDNKQNYNMWLSVTVRLIRDSLNSFLKGYNEALKGKPFPSEELIKQEKGRTSTPDSKPIDKR